MPATLWLQRLRLATGLVPMAFVPGHLFDIAPGLVSLDAVGAWHPTLVGPWQTMPGNLLPGLLSREAPMGGRDRLMQAGEGMKTALGVLLVMLGVFILAGLDKKLEGVLVEISPDWLTHLTTQF